MPRLAITLLKVTIGVLLALLVALQVWVVPVMAADYAAALPGLASLQFSGVPIAIAFLVAVEIVLGCVWRLLSLVQREAIFSAAAFPPVNVALTAVAAATTLVAATFASLAILGVLSNVLALALAFATAVGCGLCLLIVVMRALLRKALHYVTELSEVV
jgi:hypothetical protein